MTTTTPVTTDLNEWATARSGNARIRLHTLPAHLHAFKGGTIEVYALDGHETLPRTRSFTDETEARAYANLLWATL